MQTEHPEPARCCNSWSVDCYKKSNVNNNFFACNFDSTCKDACSLGAETDNCKICCRTTEHNTPWNCPGNLALIIFGGVC